MGGDSQKTISPERSRSVGGERALSALVPDHHYLL
jgi:hypothetical protein